MSGRKARPVGCSLEGRFVEARAALESLRAGLLTAARELRSKIPGLDVHDAMVELGGAQQAWHMAETRLE